MKVIIETRSGRQWTFLSLKEAKQAGAVKRNVTIKNDAIIKDGIAIIK